MKHLRKYIRNILLEAPLDVPSGKRYPKNFKRFMKLVNEHKNDVWIFFDTETTGLLYNEKHVQATEVAAIAYNMNGFMKEPSQVVNGTFNMKIALQPDTISFMDQEPEQYENPRAKTIKQLLVMTQYEEGALEKLTPLEVAESFTDYLDEMRILANNQNGKVRLIAQNAIFDVSIMNVLYSRADIPPPKDLVWDTKIIFANYLRDVLNYLSNKSKYPVPPQDQKIITALTKDYGRGPYLSASLGDIINAFDISGGENWHTAIADVELTMKALYFAVEFLKKKGNFLQTLRSERPFKPTSGDPYNWKR
jgi:DNA polymerase III epsilon subunit-like protein